MSVHSLPFNRMEKGKLWLKLQKSHLQLHYIHILLYNYTDEKIKISVMTAVNFEACAVTKSFDVGHVEIR